MNMKECRAQTFQTIFQSVSPPFLTFNSHMFWDSKVTFRWRIYPNKLEALDYQNEMDFIVCWQAWLDSKLCEKNRPLIPNCEMSRSAPQDGRLYFRDSTPEQTWCAKFKKWDVFHSVLAGLTWFQPVWNEPTSPLPNGRPDLRDSIPEQTWHANFQTVWNEPTCPQMAGQTWGIHTFPCTKCKQSANTTLQSWHGKLFFGFVCIYLQLIFARFCRSRTTASHNDFTFISRSSLWRINFGRWIIWIHWLRTI